MRITSHPDVVEIIQQRGTGITIADLAGIIWEETGKRASEYQLRSYCRENGIEYKGNSKTPDEVKEYIYQNGERSASVLGEEIKDKFGLDINVSTIASLRSRAGMTMEALNARPCEWCGKMFVPIRLNGKYCSTSCRDKKNLTNFYNKEEKTIPSQKMEEKRFAVSEISEKASEAGMSYGQYVAATEFKIKINFPPWVRKTVRKGMM
ncbi:MAG: hypothetical protein Q4B26_10095 [Eubacteriales bacterium]|nr:hypothetical protein [Eubacteriales bacterium]